mgnify:CR=1 FL=1
MARREDSGFKKGFVRCIKETPMAILCEPSDGKPFWVPQSQVHDDSDVWKEGDEGELVVTSWFAKKEGWDEDGEE